MSPSQLKRLKSSLREAGITGPQKSKKQKQDAKKSHEHVERNAKLQQLRDSFNPFELRATSARPSKHQHAVNGVASGKVRYKDVLHRPGVTKSVGEEMRRAKLLPELQRRHKVGGLIDRRIGEGDSRLTAEEKMEQRVSAGFKMKGSKAKNLFDLEDSDGDEDLKMASEWKHNGVDLQDLPQDDFKDEVSDGDVGGLVSRKRKRSESEDDEDDNSEHTENENDLDVPEYKKSKKEVMQEVIAKSKLHKYERQKAKEDDDDLREQLDKDMPDLMSLLQNQQPPTKLSQDTLQLAQSANTGTEPFMNPDRQQLLEGSSRTDVDRQYDVRLRQLAQDAKAKPSERTKTAEEKAKEEADRLRELEERRMQRMRGEQTDQVEDVADHENVDNDDHESIEDEAAEFGLKATNAISNGQSANAIALEDEDEFALDDDLIASGSDTDLSQVSDSDLQSEDGQINPEGAELIEEEDEFVQGILGGGPQANGDSEASRLAYTYPCPRSHKELLEVIEGIPVDQLSTIIQRIRALHHPSLNATNKEAMADFSAALVEHLAYMGLRKQSLHSTEQVMRHLHSLSRTYPERIAQAFRAQLKTAHEHRDVHAGDLIILTAIGSIYPTSDHWHQVVTPAITLIARWLDMNVPAEVETQRKGAFLVALCAKFQHLSKRVVPEALRFTFRALNKDTAEDETLQSHVQNLMAMANLWKDKTAFIELFSPAVSPLEQLRAQKAQQTLQILLQQARIRRRPLELHHHRPLPIRTSIPKFEDGFHPDKHYDPDKERSESRKLKNEYKRERKGALRELRKDANFIAREQLREKRERDVEYDKKYRRLVAEVQGEAGRDANEYEREKRRKKRKQ